MRSAAWEVGVAWERAMAELGSFGGGRSGAMFGAGSLGMGGGTRDPLFLLTASLLNDGSGTTTPPSQERAVVLGGAVGVPDAADRLQQ